MNVYPASAVLRREWAADLSTERLYALLRLRVEVFVVEQNCPYPELDGLDLDPATRHFWVASDTDANLPVAYLRLLEDRGGAFRIGRVCTAPDARGRGLSRRLMAAALAEVGTAPCTLGAQTQVVGLYTGFGFEPVGDEYVEDGIPHITMRRQSGR